MHRGASMHDICFRGLERIIRDYNIKTVLEYGSGISTEWFAERVEKVYTVDHNPVWFPEKLKNVTCIRMNRKAIGADVRHIKKDFDLVLLDCLKTVRPVVFDFVKNLSWKVFCIHDWGRDKKRYNRELYNHLRQASFGPLKVYYNEIEEKIKI